MGLFKFLKRKRPSGSSDDSPDGTLQIDQGLTIGSRSPSFFGRLLHKLAGKSSFLESQQRLLKDLEEEGLLIYAAKYRSQLDFLFLNSRLSQADLRPPVFAFDLRPILWLPASRAIRLLFSFLRNYLKEGAFPNPYQSGHYRELVLRREPSVLFLVGKAGYYRRFGFTEQDPLHLLLETQRQTDMPIILVPSLVFHGKAPEKQQKDVLDIFFGHKERPGRLRKLLAFLRNYKNNILEIAEPLNVKEWLADQPAQNPSKSSLAFQLRRELIDRIDRHRRVVTGPVLKSRWEMKEWSAEPALTIEPLKRCARRLMVISTRSPLTST
jgi:glycerol-3-phosphate O-acyltransferase